MKRINSILEIEKSDFIFDRNEDVIDFMGTEGTIYNVGGFAGKILNKSLARTDIRESLVREQNVCFDYYEGGVLVPKPYGVFDVKDERGNYHPAFLMEYLGDYISLANLSGEVLERASDLRNIEIEKMQSFNWKLRDVYYHGNTMYSKKLDEVRMIDFGRYKKN